MHSSVTFPLHQRVKDPRFFFLMWIRPPFLTNNGESILNIAEYLSSVFGSKLPLLPLINFIFSVNPG
jgi:hypothetical protein